MKKMAIFARIVEDRRNWLTFVLAGVIFLVGSLLLDVLGFRNGATLIVLVVIAGLTAEQIRGFVMPDADV